MGAKCIVKSCQRSEIDLFSSPRDQSQLLRWQQILETEKNEFQVCFLHFNENEIEIIRILKEGAEPLIPLEQSDSDFCSCCLTPVELKLKIDEKMRKILQELLNLKVSESAVICIDCKDKSLKFSEFKRNISMTHRTTEVAEVLLSDPFQSESIKEEFPLESVDVVKFEPEIIVESEKESRKLRQDPKTLKCLDCGLESPADELIKHRIQAHLADFICDICYKTCRTKNSLLKHIRLHSAEDSKLDCQKKIFPSQASNQKINANSKSCPICHKSMKANSIYSHIRLVHNKERDQICQVCGKALKTSYDLKVHLRQHSGERPEICESCGKTFISYAQLYKHKKVRHMDRDNFQCSICLKNLLSRFKLKRHSERFHPNGADNGIRVDPETNCYHCKICPLKFVAMHKYEKHLKLNDCHKFEGHGGIEDDGTTQKFDMRGEFKCRECGSILNTMKGLKKHIRFVHPKEPQTCKICSKQLKNPHTLWQHMTLSHKQPVKKRKI